MIKTAAYHKNCPADEILKAGFDGIELEYPQDQEAGWNLTKTENIPAASLRIYGKDLLEEDGRKKLEAAFSYGQGKDISAITVETAGILNGRELVNFFRCNLDLVRRFRVRICLENGCFFRDGRYWQNGLSTGSEIEEATAELDQEAGCQLFFGGLHTGYANLLGLNGGEIVRSLKDRLLSVCIQDNDGREDFKQMPYTFTSGRGIVTTGWTGIVQGLAEISFQGIAVVRTPGLFDGLPKPMVPIMLKLEKAVTEEWERQICFREWIGNGKKRILFGCGIRFKNYMKVWGDTYPPDLIADNDQKLWGTRKEGILICPPEDILKIPEEERAVLICNQYFIEIGKQLDDMRIPYRIYSDDYWGRYNLE